jgi:ferrous-iron efflux pump FieF
MDTHSHFHLSDFTGDKKQLKRLAAYASVSVSFLLIGAKTYAWYATHSISLLSSLTDSILDFVASMINMIAIHLAVKPADEEHRFGHGKIEALAALFQSIIIILSATFVLKEAIERVFDPQPLEKPLVGIIITCITIVLTFILVRFQHYVIHKTKSMAILADSTHYKADLYLNLGVLLSIGTYILFQWNYVDILFGAGIAIYIMFTTYKIISSALKVLLDSELPSFDREQILKIIQAHPEIKKCCHLKTRTSGQEEFIQGHLIMNETITMKQAHQAAKSIKKELEKVYPNAECLFQIQPHNPIKEKDDSCCE